MLVVHNYHFSQVWHIKPTMANDLMYSGVIYFKVFVSDDVKLMAPDIISLHRNESENFKDVLPQKLK